MKTTKRFWLLFLLICTFFFLGCEGINPTPSEDEEKILTDAFKKLFVGVNRAKVEGDLEFLTEVDKAKISYESSNIIVINNLGKVTRQDNDTVVTITITLTYNESKLVKKVDFNVCAKIPSYTIKEAKDKIGQTIELEGVVTGILGTNKVYLEDSTDAIYLYNVKEALLENLKVGNKVKVTGAVSDYNGNIQVGNVTNVTLVSSNNKVADPIEVITIDDLAKYEYKKISISELIVKSIKGNIDSENVSIVVTDQIKDVTVYISKYILSDEKTKLSSTIKTLAIGDILTIEEAYVGYYNTVQIELFNSKITFKKGSGEVVKKYDLISDIIEAGQYKSFGQVVAKTKNSFVLQDTSGMILVYTGSTPSVEIGKNYVVSGEVVIFNRGFEYKNVTCTLSNEELNILTTDPVYLDSSLVTIIQNLNNIQAKYIEISGNLYKSGNYTNMSIPNLNGVEVAPSGIVDFTNYYGKDVTIIGYLTGITSSGTKTFVQTVVSEIKLKAESTPLTKIEITGTDGKVNLGSTTLLAVKYTPSETSLKQIAVWTSSDESIATVNEFGEIVAKKQGTVTITAKVGNLTATKEIKVETLNSINPRAVYLAKNQIKVYLDEEYSFEPLYLPKDANTNTEVTYRSLDESIVKIVNGVAVGVSSGTTQIEMKIYNGYTYLVDVTVRKHLVSGYGIEGTVNDYTVYTVKSAEELKDTLLKASSRNLKQITIKFDTTEPITSQIFFAVVNKLAGGWNPYNAQNNTCTITIALPEDYASNYVEITSKSEYVDIINAATYLRNEAIENSPNKRSSDFNDFNIYKNNKGTISVKNSNELVYALELGYLPTFSLKDSKAEAFFEEAKAILREIVTDDMTDLEKVREIYDYICENSSYDYDVLSAANRYTYGCQYLEGFFEERRAVCEGFAKVVVLFCRIEGIEAVVSEGFAVAGAGHAWNYVKIDGKWYTLCTTYGQRIESEPGAAAKMFGYKIESTNYVTFLAAIDYMYDGYSAIRSRPDIEAEADGSYIEGIVGYEKVPGTSYDYEVNSLEELKGIFKAITDSDCPNEYFVPLTSKGYSFDSNTIQSILLELGLKNVNVTVNIDYYKDLTQYQGYYTVFVKAD